MKCGELQVSQVFLGLLVFLAGCEGLWPTDAPYDPKRCTPRCKIGEVCFQGACKSALQDSGADLDAAGPDSPSADGLKMDGPVTDQPVPDAPLPDAGLDQPALDAPLPDQPLPDLPIPDAPLPDQPMPDQPIPDAPLVDLPMPDQPIPDAPLTDQPPIVCNHPTVHKSCKGDTLGMSWCAIPAGCFWMGSPAGENCRNQTNEDRHPVTLTHSLEIMAAEVTQMQFQMVMSYYPPSHKTCGMSCPIENITWHEAAAFANALSARRGLTPCYQCTGTGKTVTCQDAPAFSGAKMYTCPGFRLPFEAEWEYAYRAGTTAGTYKGAIQISSCTSNASTANTIAWYNNNSPTTPQIVGLKEPNLWGLSDVAGNVWEWCNDKYKKNLGTAPATDPPGGTSGDRAIRGGAYNSAASSVRAAYRTSVPATLRQVNIGLRLVRTTDVPGGWVTVKAGKFQMGSPAAPVAEPCRDATREDQHQVTLTHDFAIQATEVTQGMFEGLMGYNPSHYGPAGAGANCGSNCPVEKTNWHEAAAYCNALSQKEGLPLCYHCTGTGTSMTCAHTFFPGQMIYGCPGFRLPTEAEWEYAYRAGTTTALYNGTIANCTSADTNASKIGWYINNASSKTHPAGEKDPNAWKLYDMAGNVWEWCNDYFVAKLGTAPVTDPVGPSTGTKKAMHGGSLADTAHTLRAAYRDENPMVNHSTTVGFRCVRTLDPGRVDSGELSLVKKTGDQHARGIAFDGTNFLVVWKEGTAGKYRVFASRVSQTGTAWGPSGGMPLVGVSGQEDNPDVSYNGKEHLVVWADKRHGDFDIYGTRFSRDGKVLDTTGIQIYKGSGDQRLPKIAFDGTNHLVTWQDHSGSQIQIKAARITPGGKVLDTTPLSISHKPAGSSGWGAVHFTASYYLVVWSDGSSTSADLHGRRVTPAGAVLDPSSIIVSSAVQGQLQPAISSLAPTFLVVWADGRTVTTADDIYAGRIQHTGKPLDTLGIEVSGASGNQCYPAIANDGKEHFAVWADTRKGNSDIYGARINLNAQVLDKAGTPLVTDLSVQARPLIARGASSYLVVYTDDRNGDWDIYGVRVAP